MQFDLRGNIGFCSVSFAPGPLETENRSDVGEDGHPNHEGKVAERKRIKRSCQVEEPVTRQSLTFLEGELGPEYTPSMVRLRRRQATSVCSSFLSFRLFLSGLSLFHTSLDFSGTSGSIILASLYWFHDMLSMARQSVFLPCHFLFCNLRMVVTFSSKFQRAA